MLRSSAIIFFFAPFPASISSQGSIQQRNISGVMLISACLPRTAYPLQDTQYQCHYLIIIQAQPFCCCFCLVYACEHVIYARNETVWPVARNACSAEECDLTVIRPWCGHQRWMLIPDLNAFLIGIQSQKKKKNKTKKSNAFYCRM